MTDELAVFWVHDVVLERYTGTGAYGDEYAAPTAVTGLVDGTIRLVRDATGQEVISTMTVFLPATTADVPLKSQVTVPAEFGGRTYQVVTVARRDAGSLPTPDHLEIALR